MATFHWHMPMRMRRCMETGVSLSPSSFKCKLFHHASPYRQLKLTALEHYPIWLVYSFTKREVIHTPLLFSTIQSSVYSIIKYFQNENKKHIAGAMQQNQEAGRISQEKSPASTVVSYQHKKFRSAFSLDDVAFLTSSSESPPPAEGEKEPAGCLDRLQAAVVRYRQIWKKYSCSDTALERYIRRFSDKSRPSADFKLVDVCARLQGWVFKDQLTFLD